MKAIEFNNDFFEITGERGDFWITKNNKGKVKMFAKSEVELEIVELESLPKAKSYKAAKSSKPNYEFTKRMVVVELEDRSSATYILDKIQEITEPSDIVKSICDYANNHAGIISDKQAWVLAKFLDDNKIKL